MKIVFLSGYNVIHTVRWVNSLCDRGHEVHLLSLHRKGDRLDPRVIKVILPFPPPLGYYLNVPFVRSYLRKVKPNLVNAHYASGYGTLGRLTRFHPYVLSVWGSDVYDFPNHTERNRKLVVKNLRCADMVCSTSHVMAKQTQKVCPSLMNINVTPFGIDVEKFFPQVNKIDNGNITIGTVKRLEPMYGVDILLKAFSSMRDELLNLKPEMAGKLRLLIVGGGSQLENLKNLATQLGIERVTFFEGSVLYKDVPSFLHKLDVYAALSRFESFGVAILEASSCGLPVVVSDADGPCEVVKNKQTGLIVHREDIEESAQALKKLVLNKALRVELGVQGRKHVVRNYSWDHSVDILEQSYKDIVEGYSSQRHINTI